MLSFCNEVQSCSVYIADKVLLRTVSKVKLCDSHYSDFGYNHPLSLKKQNKKTTPSFRGSIILSLEMSCTFQHKRKCLLRL